MNSESVKQIDEYAAKNEWSRWVYNKDKGHMKFIVDDRDEITFPSNEIVLMAFPVDSIDTPFSGWFTDSDYKMHFTEAEVSGAEVSLYGKWCNAVIFDAGEGSVHLNYKGVLYRSTYGELPVPELFEHTFLVWVTSDGSKVITSDTVVNTAETHTVHAVWAANNYTMTFDLKNGNSKLVSLVAYNSTIEYPAEPVRKGYEFNRWNDTVKVMPAHDVTIEATWVKNKGGFPWWGILAIALGAVVIMAIVTVVVVCLLVKKKKKVQYQNLRTPLGEN